jgi:hypothetical protein
MPINLTLLGLLLFCRHDGLSHLLPKLLYLPILLMTFPHYECCNLPLPSSLQTIPLLLLLVCTLVGSWTIVPGHLAKPTNQIGVFKNQSVLFIPRI